MKNMKKLLFIINPKAGMKTGRKLLPEMITRLTGAGYLCTVIVTEKRGQAAETAAELGGDADMVAACGGDGTLNEVITGMLRGGHSTVLGYIPCGSTNDFAAGLGIPTDLMKACGIIAEGSPVTIDAGRFGADRFFSYTASFGAFTAVSYSTPQNVKNVIGHAAYILEGIRSLADIRPVHMKVTVGDRVIEDDFIFGAVCNSTSLGGVLKLDNSEVHMNDGLFETLLIPFPPDLIALNKIIIALTSHDYNDPSLIFLRAPEFRFESDTEVSWTLDGESAEGGKKVTITNISSAITLMTEPGKSKI